MDKITQKDIWRQLKEIDIEPYIRQKGQLGYLPWSVAVGLVKPYYDMSVKVYENELGFNYHTDGITCWVKVGVMIADYEEIEYLPVMDLKNKSIKKDMVTSVDVNKTIKRATVKALASFGLGISLYAGEELPSQTEDEINNTHASPSQLQELTTLMTETDSDLIKMLEFVKVDKFDNITVPMYEKLKKALISKKMKNLKG